MNFRPTTQSDLDYVKANPLQESVKALPDMHPIGDCRTASIGDVIIGVGGVVLLWPGVGEFWLMLTKDVKEHTSSLTVMRGIKEFIDEIIEVRGIDRAQSILRADFDAAIKMNEFLGFKREGLMRKYLPDGSDAYIYARVK